MFPFILRGVRCPPHSRQGIASGCVVPNAGQRRFNWPATGRVYHAVLFPMLLDC